jgi:PhnB protein
LVFKDAAAAIAYYQRVFNAMELTRHVDGQGRIRHAEIKIADSTLMLVSENRDYDFIRSIETLGDSPIQLFVYLHDVEAVFRRALEAGGKVVMPIEEQTYGRSGGFRDPFGLIWWVSTHKPQS